MSEEIFCIVYTKDGKQELTEKQWVNFNDSKLHRENNLPAVERSSGTKFWYLNGKLHRTDGPAIERFDGFNKYWYLDNQEYPEQNFNQEINKVKNMNSLERMLDPRDWVRNFKE
jgi:hypothetical protein